MRNPKGTVTVQSHRNMLRLRLPRHLFGGEQKHLYLNLADTPINRKSAEAKAAVIEADIAFDRFDVTLDSYRPQVHAIKEKPLNLVDLWEQYTAYKTPLLSNTTLKKDYRKVKNHLASLPSEATAKQIRKHLMQNLTPAAAKKVLMFINACCEWAAAEDLIENNPYANLTIAAKPIGKNINPFSRAEQELILRAFEAHPNWSCYTDFVKFLFWTGCRPSEAIALQWQHISPDLTVITFAEAVVIGNRKDTKTHKTRKFPCNSAMQALLKSLKTSGSQPLEPLFKSPDGYQIDGHNFQNRAWKPILSSLPIRYRPSYNTRHTFITLCLDDGIPVTQVASWVGNSPKTIWEHYAGLVSTHDVPDFG